jgi:alpha-N-arabinofuranosidase
MPQHNGIAAGWEPIGPRESWFLLEHIGGHNGTDAEVYTAHFDGRNGSACQRQRAECFRAGATCGIAQRGIPLSASQAYEGRVVLRADRALRVRVAIAGAEASIAVGPGEWTGAPFAFTAPATTDDARLEITFEGPGALFVGAVSLLPADHFHGMRRDVVALLKQIGVPLLRWPGGNFAGDYHWQDGLLPVDKRAPLKSAFIETLPHTDGFDDHEIGTDEFIALCRELGAEPFITINLSTEGPAEAAAWVEYCDGSPDTKWGRLRAERGHPEPYRVTHWTLGNEMGYSHMKGPNAPPAYHDLASACARAMKQVDPSLIFTASTGWSQEWYRGLLAPDEDYFDHVSHHTYDKLLRVFEGEQGCRDFRRLMDAVGTVFHGTGLEGGKQPRRLSMRDIRDFINARPAGRKPLGIAFDEWNVWYAWYRVPGVAEGVYAALMLNHFCREARRLGMTLGAYFEPVNEGAILVEPGSARLTPVGQVHALFKPHHGGRLLDVSGSEGDLDVAASVRAGEVTLTVVNRSPNEGHDAEIAIEGTAHGVLLASSNFIPGSEFHEGPLDVRQQGDVLAFSMPPHSVARISLPHTSLPKVPIPSGG